MKKEAVLFLIIFSSFVIGEKIGSFVEEELEEKDIVPVIIIKEEERNSVEIKKEDLEGLKENSSILRVEYNYPVKMMLQDSIKIINASVVHSLIIDNNITGLGETICILDTGINSSHPALKNKVVGERCFLEDNSCPDGGSNQSGVGSGEDDNGHGTHVAGIVAGNDTIIGVAPNAYLVSVKVLNSNGDGSSNDIINGIQWCVDNKEVYNISVISMSLGTSTPHLFSGYCDDEQTSYRDVINEAVDKNITIVAATGNEGNSVSIALPACIGNATAVGWTNKDDTINLNSNRNSITDFFAPGTDINSTSITGDYITMEGTSMSTPHVSGAIALIQQYFKEENNYSLLVDEVKDALNKTGKFINESGLLIPRIDVYEAINSLNIVPRIILDYPRNISYNNGSLDLKYSIIESSLDSCWYSLDNNSYTIDNCGNTSFNTTEGDHNLTLFANDSFGNENYTSIEFNVDLTLPSVNLSNLSFSSNSSVIFNYRVEDVAIDNCSLVINDEVNVSDDGVKINNDKIFNIILYDGDYNYWVNCTDLAGNENNSINYSLNISCSESWDCGDWSDDDCGSRTCIDYNYCGSSYDKPNESKECPQSDNGVGNTGGDSGGGGGGGSVSSNANVPEPSDDIIIPEENIPVVTESKEEEKEEVKEVGEKGRISKIIDKIKDLFSLDILTGEVIREKKGKELFKDIVMGIFRIFKFILTGS